MSAIIKACFISNGQRGLRTTELKPVNGFLGRKPGSLAAPQKYSVSIAGVVRNRSVLEATRNIVTGREDLETGVRGRVFFQVLRPSWKALPVDICLLKLSSSPM